jgi:hypothetical protein
MSFRRRYVVFRGWRGRVVVGVEDVPALDGERDGCRCHLNWFFLAAGLVVISSLRASKIEVVKVQLTM